MATGADTRETNSPICAMPLAVFEGPMTGTLARTANGSAAKACWDRLARGSQWLTVNGERPMPTRLVRAPDWKASWKKTNVPVGSMPVKV